MQNNQPQNSTDVPVDAIDERLSKLMNYLREALNDSSINNIVELQTLFRELMASSDLSLADGNRVLSKFASEIRSLAEYPTFLRMFNTNGINLFFGKSWTDFSDPTERRAAIISNLISLFPDVYQEVLKYPRNN